VAGALKTEIESLALLVALESELLTVETIAMTVSRGLKSQRFAGYRRFRQKIDDLRALIVLIEERLPALVNRHGEPLKRQFEFLDLLLLTMIVHHYKEFSDILSDSDAMPLGAHEIFSPDLHVLDDARERLSQPGYAERVDDGVLADMETAVAAMRRVLARIRPLPDLSSADPLPEAAPESPMADFAGTRTSPARH